MQTQHNMRDQAELLLVMLLTLAAIVCANDPVRPLHGTAFGYYSTQQIE